MSVKVSNWAWHDARDRDGNKITGNDLILLLALADVADDSGRSKYASELTYDSLAEKTGVAKRTIVRVVARLSEEGLIEYRAGVKGRSNEFVCLIPGVAKSGDTLAPNGESDAAHSVPSVQDSVPSATTFGDKPRTRTSLRRIDVTTDVNVEAAATAGQRFARALCDVLSVELTRNGVKHTISKQWLDAARLMVDVDGRDPHEARELIVWACRDSFWAANVHSMPTVRKQYDKLRLKRGAPSQGTIAGGQVAANILRDRRAAREQKQVAS